MATVSERSPDLVLLLARRGYGSPRRLEALRAAVAARLADETGFAGPVVLGFAELAVPSVSDALDMFADRGRIRVLVVDLIVPADMSLRGWLPGVLHDWANRRGVALDIAFSDPVDGDPAFVSAVVSRITGGAAEDVRQSPATDSRPSWNDPPDHAVHLFACDGPRCAHRGSGAVWAAMLAALEGAGLRGKTAERVMVTRTRCLYPCNRGPVATLHPGGFWYAVPDAEAARRIAVEHLKNGRPVADLLFREGGR